VNDMEAVNPEDIEVIGVIPDRRYRDLRETPPAQAYFPYFEDAHFRFMNVYLRTQANPHSIEDALRQRLRQFDPHVPVVDLETVSEQIEFSLRTERLMASLSALFGGVATLLAAVGLYGVMAYSMTRRTREVGIRMALGALRADVIWMVMGEVAVLVAGGMAVGLPLALALSGLARSQLYGLEPRDPATLAAAILTLGCAAALAGFVPAWRASRIHPVEALRHE
jgi:ABC-type antimicrobial peptide transport system permease subunit